MKGTGYLTLSFAVLCIVFHASSDASVPVRTADLASLLRLTEYSAPATVQPQNSPDIASELMANVLDIPVHVGDRVAQGDRLLSLDCRHPESQLTSARAGLKELQVRYQFAQQQLQRSVGLRKKNSISQELLEQRQSESGSIKALIQSQQEQIEQARLHVEDCILLAPFDALVTQRHTSVGALVSQGTPLIHLIQMDDVEISAQLRGQQGRSLESASSIVYRFQDRNYRVQIKHLLPLIDARLKTQEARLRFLDEAAIIGSAGRLVWQPMQRQLPSQYLVRRNGELGLMLEDNLQARFWPLHDAIEGQPAQLDLADFPAQTQVIIEGQQGLDHGDRIQVTD